MMKFTSFLGAAALLMAFSAQAQTSKAPIATPPAWDHAGHIRLCDGLGDKRCSQITIPPGVGKGMTGVVSTKIIPGVAHGFLIAGRKDVYLCASGIDAARLRCQRIPPATQALGESATGVTAAHVQNTITLLLSARPSRPANNPRTLGCDGEYDNETGELGIGDCDYDPGTGGRTGPWSDVPDPETNYHDGMTAQDIAGPWITEALRENEIAFLHSGRDFWMDSAQCNVVIARCREDCGDRATARQGLCLMVSGLIALGPGLAKGAAIIFEGVCAYQVSERNSICKGGCGLACFPE